jgi:hypothetical protein
MKEIKQKPFSITGSHRKYEVRINARISAQQKKKFAELLEKKIIEIIEGFELMD